MSASPPSPPERVLSAGELNRATLARQLLLERKRLSPVAVIERLVGMQAQSAPAPYVGIWTRTTGFRRERLERELESGAVIRATAMRQTLHVVTRRDYGLVRSAMSDMNFPWESPRSRELAPVVRALVERGPLRTAEARALLEGDAGLSAADARLAWRYGRLAAHVVHHTDAARWQPSRADTFVAIDVPERHDPTEARDEIIRRYLAAFGPATRRDIVAWSMIHAPKIQQSLDRLELRRFVAEDGRELLDLPGAPLPAADVPAPVRFLPKWDNLLLAYHDRTRVLPERHRRTVIKVNGDVAPTFLVGGMVAGVWRVEDGRVVTEPFERLSRAAAAELAEETARLEAFLA